MHQNSVVRRNGLPVQVLWWHANLTLGSELRESREHDRYIYRERVPFFQFLIIALFTSLDSSTPLTHGVEYPILTDCKIRSEERSVRYGYQYVRRGGSDTDKSLLNKYYDFLTHP